MVRILMLLTAFNVLLLPCCRRAGEASSGQTPVATDETVPPEPVSESTRDAIDLAIVACAPRLGMCNPFTLSPETEGRLSRYKASYEAGTEGGLFSTPVGGGTKVVIPDGSVLHCTFHGDLELTVRFMAGTVGIQNNEIFVEEGTKCQVDSNVYVFQGGRWRQR